MFVMCITVSLQLSQKQILWLLSISDNKKDIHEIDALNKN